MYMSVILNVNLMTNSIHLCTINDIQVLYGNVYIDDTIYTPLDNQPYALIVIGEYNNVTYSTVYYNRAISALKTPDNRVSFIQKLPHGVFDGTSDDTLIGNIATAYAKMLNEYYNQYFYTISQVFGTSYSSNLEFEYNGTSGLLSNSLYPQELFLLFAQNKQYRLNIYDLELFISQYIYFRIGLVDGITSYAVHIEDGVVFGDGQWILNDIDNSILGHSTILGSGNSGKQQNIVWTIYGIYTKTDIQQEVINMINRMSRADIGNEIAFSIHNYPTEESVPKFITSVLTFKTDLRTNANRCIAYTGLQNYPLNVIGYI